MFSSILVKQGTFSENDLDNLSTRISQSAPLDSSSRSDTQPFSNPLPLDLPLIEKKPSNFETIDIIEQDPPISFEEEIKEEKGNPESESFKEYASLSLNIEDPEVRRISICSKQNNVLESDVYTKELKQCDFQLTYSKSEYKKEYLGFELLQKLNSVIYGKERSILSWPNCITTNPSSFLVCGGSGNFLIFSKKTWQYEIFQTQGSLRKINCCEISEDGLCICVGDSQGSLGVYDMKKKKLLKLMQCTSDQAGILALRILYQEQESLNNLQVLTSDTNGVVKVTTITKGMFKYSSEQRIIMECGNKPPFQYVSLLDKEIQLKYSKVNVPDKLVAFLSFESVKIFSYSTVTLSMHRVFEFKNPEYNLQTFSYLDMKYLSLSWGEGFVVEVSDYLYKVCTQVITWKNSLYVVKALPSQSSKSQQARCSLQFEQSSALVFEKNILSVGFVAPSVIIIVDEEQTIFLVNMSDLKRLFSSSVHIKDLCKDCGIMPFPLPAKEKFMSQMHKISTQSAVLTYNNVFCQNQGENEVIFILDGKMGVTALTKWTTIYSGLIENGEWRQAMHYLTNIYYAKDKFVTDLPSKQIDRQKLLQESVKIVTQKYLDMCEKIFRPTMDNSYKKNMVGLIIEFLVLTDNFEMLFSDLKDIVERLLKSKDVFIEALVPFIRKHKVKIIPMKILQDLITYFIEKGHTELAEVMLIQLDSSQVDSHTLMEVCIKKGLIRALIYICTRGGEDVYMTPLSKLWGHYLSQKYLLDGDDYNDSPLTKFLKCEATEECKGLGMRSLWYVKLCLKQHTITGEIIPFPKFESLVVHIAEWIFNVNNLQEILMLSPQTSFELISLFFSSLPAKIVNRHNLVVSKRQRSRVQSRLSISSMSGSFSRSNSINQNINSILGASTAASQLSLLESFQNSTMLDEVLDAIYFAFDSLISSDSTSNIALIVNSVGDKYKHIGQQSEQLISQIKQEYFAFIAKLFLQDSKKEISSQDMERSRSMSQSNSDSQNLFTVKQAQVFESLVYFAENPKSIGCLPVISKFYVSDDDKKVREEDKMEMRYTDIYCQMIQRAQFDQEQIQALNKSILQSFSFSCIKADIYAQEKEFAKSLDCLLLSSNPLVQNYFFSWLPLLLKKIENDQNPSQTIEVEQQIQTKLLWMIRIDAEKTRSLISDHLSHLEARMLRTMHEFPDKQLEYIEQSLKERNSETISTDLLTLYTELLCALRPQCLLDELQKYEYDIEACLAVTIRYNAKEACAYLLEKNGNIPSCFVYHLEFLNDICSQLFLYENNLSQEQKSEILKYQNERANDPSREINSFLVQIENMKGLFNKQFEKMDELIKKGTKNNGQEDGEKLLYNLLDVLSEITSKTEIFSNLIYSNFSKLIMEAHLTTNSEQLVSKIKSKYGNLQLLKLSKVFSQIFWDLEYTQQTYLNIEESLSNYFGDTMKSFMSHLQSGLSSNSICQSCQMKDEEEIKPNTSMMIFKCGHMYHSSCYKENKAFVQNKISDKDKKSSFLEYPLCFACLSKSSLAMAILFSETQKTLKDKLSYEVVFPRQQPKEQKQKLENVEKKETQLTKYQKTLLSFDLERLKKNKAFSSAHDIACQKI